MKKPILFLIVILFFNPLPIYSQYLNGQNNIYKKSNVQEDWNYTKFNINNISTYVHNNGVFDQGTNYWDDGFMYPKTEGLPLLWDSGLVWGGKIGDSVFAGGTYYNTGLIPGKILDNGFPEDPQSPSAGIRRVRTDYANANLSFEAKDIGKTQVEIRDQYQKDWNEWPAEFGAPFEDLDNNGIYNPTIDIPGVPGAHQTIWFVANDFDTLTCRNVLGSNPMKLELQVTVWGYNIPQTIYDNVMFKKYKIINKNDVDIDSMYLSQWCHTNLFDGYIGVDTLVDLGYFYNGDGFDEYFYGSNVPAVGFQFLQGPIVNSPGDIAYSDAQFINNYKNLKPNAFYDFSDHLLVNPSSGDHYEWGTVPYYYHMKGLQGGGEKILIPEQLGGGTTTFPYSGNPITQEGWIDGLFIGPTYRGLSYSIGPFQLKVGQSQEIVIAQFAAMGKDHLNSVALLKYYADILKTEYPNFNLSNPIPNIGQLTPTINEYEFSEYDVIELNIDRKDSIEQYSGNGYDFQGFNIYQSERPTKFNSAAHKLFTYDKSDDVTNIYGNTYDPSTGYLQNGIVFNGSNNGIPKSVKITKDYIINSKLIKGKTYYFGISSYYYNTVENKTVESPLDTISVIYQRDLPGAKYLDQIKPKILDGNSDAEFIIEIVDPEKLTGNTYEITFAEQHYYLDIDGEWKKTHFPDSVGKILNKPGDQSPSTLIPMVSIYAPNQTLDVHFTLDIKAPDFNWADAVSITFPDGIVINSGAVAGGNHNEYPVIEGQTVTWGTPGALSADGGFSGGEDLMVNINSAEPTFTVDYVIYDDGWSAYFADATGDSVYYNLGSGTIDGYGKVTLTGKVGYRFKTVPYWRLTDKTTNEIKLEEIEIVNLGEWYPYGDQYGEESILDGFKIKFGGSIDAPINFLSTDFVNDTETTLSNSYGFAGEGIVLTNYTVFGGLTTSYAADNFGVGTYSVDELQQDYEIRFTGVFDEGTVINGQTVYSVIEGGSMATCFRMVSGTALATNPFNPNYGTAEPFLIRVPFEVWNVDDSDNPYQVNVTFRDRERNGTEDPFWAWNLDARMYVLFVNTPYNPDQVIQVDGGPDEFNANTTWVMVFKKSNYAVGDIVKVTYTNPIQFSDVYSFTTPTPPKDKISPNKYQVFQNYPNPFNPNTTIRYFIPEEGIVNISIYNILGQKVTEVINKNVRAGKYETEFNGSKFASGVYIYRIEVDSPTKANIYSETKKMLLLK